MFPRDSSIPQTRINRRHVHYKLSCSKVEDMHVGPSLNWMLQIHATISNSFNTDYPNIQYVDITRLHNEYSIRCIIPTVSGNRWFRRTRHIWQQFLPGKRTRWTERLHSMADWRARLPSNYLPWLAHCFANVLTSSSKCSVFQWQHHAKVMQPNVFSFHWPAVEKCQPHRPITLQNTLSQSYPSILVYFFDFWRFRSSTIPLLPTAGRSQKGLHRASHSPGGAEQPQANGGSSRPNCMFKQAEKQVFVWNIVILCLQCSYNIV